MPDAAVTVAEGDAALLGPAAAVAAMPRRRRAVLDGFGLQRLVPGGLGAWRLGQRLRRKGGRGQRLGRGGRCESGREHAREAGK